MRDGRVVEGARLESVYTVKGIKGSNPFLSTILTIFKQSNFQIFVCCFLCSLENFR